MHVETPNLVISSAVEQRKLHEVENSKGTTLLEEVNNANRKNNLYNSIQAYLKDLIKHAKPEGIKLKGYRVSKGLLMKKNQL